VSPGGRPRRVSSGPRSPQGGRRNERSLTSTTPWRSAVPPPPSPQGPGGNHRRLRLRTDSGGMAGTSVPAGNRWGDRSIPAARAVGVLQASARGARSGFGPSAGGAELEVVPRRGTKPMEDGASLRLATAARRPDSSAEQRLEGGCLPGMVSRGSGNGTARLRPRHGKKGAWRSASADSSPPGRPGSADSCSSQRCASAVRVLRGPHERWNVTGATAVVTLSGCWRGNLRGV